MDGDNIAEVGETKRVRLLRPQTTDQTKKLGAKEQRHVNLRKVSSILQKSEGDRKPEDLKILDECPEVVTEARHRLKKRETIKKRLEEFEDPEDVLIQKCQVLAQAIAQSQHLVVYTGAGISTAAKIPDYRGPDGIWTRLKEGRDVGEHDLSMAEPTYTHMALYELYRQKILKYVVSQNCDGLHLRSGLPRTALSELHGNMYIEVCKTCKPPREYWRLFDVTENTARYAHKTYRKCYVCNGSLMDTIVHFGERGSLQWPLNWKEACKNAKEATTIICLGSSLKVLKKYPWLWQMDKPAKKRPNLYIVNLQWTPKDDCANVKINGKCDAVFKKIMRMLGIKVPKYQKANDPVFRHATELNQLELHTNSRPCLVPDLSVNEVKYYNDVEVKSEQGRLEDCRNNSSDLNFNCDITFSNIVHSYRHFLEPLFLRTDKLLHPYTDLFLYPYQTSFLYPGLHSIINPMPVIKEETIVPTKQDDEIKEPACDFCFKSLKSTACLFYQKVEPIFAQQTFRYSKVEKRSKPNVCVCCDYTTEEDDDVLEVSGGSDREASGSGEQKARLQPGWFGKGYGKARRFKRKAA